MGDDWQTLRTAAITALVGVLTAVAVGLKGVIGKWLQRWQTRIDHDSTIQALSWSGMMRRAARQFTDLEFVDRVLMLILVDRSKKKQCLVKAFDGWAKNNHQDPLDLYSHTIKVDAHYLDLINTMIDTGRCVITVKDMPPGSLLKGYYEAEGVVFAVLYLLKYEEDKDRLIYMSVASYSREFTAREQTSAGIIADQIRSTIM